MTDFDACWDAIVDVENQAYENGVKEGQAEADLESRAEGHRAGFLRGYALGLEVGFVQEAACDALKGSEAGEESRQARRLATILKIADELPCENDRTVDFDSKVRELRALYKLCGSPAGAFRPLAQAADPSKRQGEGGSYSW